jgi:hypothetical protein
MLRRYSVMMVHVQFVIKCFQKGRLHSLFDYIMLICFHLPANYIFHVTYEYLIPNCEDVSSKHLSSRNH